MYAMCTAILWISIQPTCMDHFNSFTYLKKIKITVGIWVFKLGLGQIVTLLAASCSLISIFSSNSQHESKYMYIPKFQTIPLTTVDLF